MSSAEALAASFQPVFRDNEEHFRRLAEALAVPIYSIDTVGRITFYNDAAAEFWGRRPQIGTSYWCGSLRLYWPDETPLPHEQCPAAIAVKEKRAVRGMEALVERPDGTRAAFVPYPTPMFDASGELVGAVNMLVDISDRKKAEVALHRQTARLESLNRIAKVLTSDLDLERIVQAATDGATALSGAQFGAFFYNHTDEKGEQYLLYTLSGAPREAFSKFGLPRNTAVFEPTFRGERTVRSDDIRRDPRYGLMAPHLGMPKEHLPVVSYLAVPVVSRSGEVHGALFFGHEKAGVFTAESEEIVEAIAAHTAVAIDNANLLRASQREVEQRRRAEEALSKRMAEQSALHHFTDRLHRAQSLQEIYDAALDSICSALDCDRSSILLFDDANVMRFVAWRGLSLEYRAAVEGHSPWAADIKDPQPVAVSDLRTAGLSDDLQATVQAEGIGSLAFIPLVTNNALIGKFMTYYPKPYAFSEAEIELSVTIARQLAFSIARMRAEDAVRRKEASERARAEELQAVMQAVPAVVWIARDPDCKSIIGNRAAQEFLKLAEGTNQSLSAPEGERPSHFEVLAGGRVLSPEELPVQRAARGEEVPNFEEEVRFSDGTRRYLIGNATPLRSPDGALRGSVAAFMDITERREIEQALRAKDAELEAIITRTPFMFIRYDKDLRYRFASPAYLHLLGRSASEVIDRSIQEVIGQRAFEALRPHFEKALRGEQVEWESEVDFAGIGPRFIRGVYYPEYDARGSVTGCIASLLDVSDRRRADHAIRRLALLVESSDDAIISKDLNGAVTSWNTGAERIFGYTAAEIIGKPITTIIPEDRHGEELEILKRLRQGERVESFETIRRRKDGSVLDISLTISPVKDADGRIVGASKIARDISDRKQADAALRQNESFLRLQKDSLELLLRGAPLRTMLDRFVRGMEEQSARRMFAAVHLLSPDGTQFQEAVAPSLPPSYGEATNGMRVNSRTGPCCYAILGGKTVIVPDVGLDQKWKAFAAFMQPLGIQSGWSAPIITSDGRIVATFASYYSDAGAPSEQDLQMIEVVTRTLALAIERKQAEQALRDGERRLQELLAAIPAAIYTTDKSGKITYYNEAAVEFAGRRPILGSDEWCVSWKLFWPDGTPLPHDQCPMAVALKEGRPIRGKEAIAERPDGSRVPFIPFPTPLRDAAGNVVGGINMLVDISERKQSETHQRLLLRELNHRVKNNMQMLHVLLNSSLRASRSPETRTILEDASRRVGAMAAAQQILYGTSSGTTFRADEFLQSVCQTALQTFAKNIRIKIEKAEGVLSNDSAAPLALIFNELLTNAVKHGLNGKDGEIRAGIVNNGTTFTLYVEDDGPGFNFEHTAKRSSGLALVQALARQLKGQLEVTKGNGTRCILRFSESGNVEA